MSFLFYKLLDTYSHNTLLTIRAVIGHDDDLVRRLAYFVFQYNQVLGTTSQDRQHAVARCLQSLDYWEHWCHTDTTTGTYHGAEVLDVSGITQRSYNISDIVALIELAQLNT